MSIQQWAVGDLNVCQFMFIEKNIIRAGVELNTEGECTTNKRPKGENHKVYNLEGT